MASIQRYNDAVTAIKAVEEMTGVERYKEGAAAGRLPAIQPEGAATTEVYVQQESSTTICQPVRITRRCARACRPGAAPKEGAMALESIADKVTPARVHYKDDTGSQKQI